MTSAPPIGASSAAPVGHFPLWIIPLVLEPTGETLPDPPNGAGTAEGRLAFLDLLFDGRSGGLVTGDKATIDFSPDDLGLKARRIGCRLSTAAFIRSGGLIAASLISVMITSK